MQEKNTLSPGLAAVEACVLFSCWIRMFVNSSSNSMRRCSNRTRSSSWFEELILTTIGTALIAMQQLHLIALADFTPYKSKRDSRIGPFRVSDGT